MPQFAISITKRISFRGGTQEFANTYHYDGIGTEPNAGQADSLIDFVVTEEKKWHSTLVTFVLGRCWSSGGSIASNQMISEKALTGTGVNGTISGFDPERAVLIQWPAGVDSRGRPVYLRKWYHTCGPFGSVSFSNAQMSQTANIGTTDRATIVGLVDNLSRIPVLDDWGLVAESGRVRDGGLMSATPPQCHPWLEHHQLGDQWRG